MDERSNVGYAPLSGATKVAIVALWGHVVLSGVLLLGAIGAGSAGGFLLSLISGVLWGAIAVGLQRRAVGAWWAGVSIAGMSYAAGLFHGTVVSTVLLILVPLLLARPGDVQTAGYSVPPSAEWPDETRRRLPLGWPYMSDD